MSELSSEQKGISEEIAKPIELPDPAQFARLIDLINPGGSAIPQTQAERQLVRETWERRREDERRLRRELPPSTGEVEHDRMTW